MAAGGSISFLNKKSTMWQMEMISTTTTTTTTSFSDEDDNVDVTSCLTSSNSSSISISSDIDVTASTAGVYTEIQGQQEQLKAASAPTVMDILNFAIPAIGVYLCSPLLSMIDTSSVGLFCGTLQQAALNPAVTITDYSARTMSFLYNGTTNIIASFAGNGNSNRGDKKSIMINSNDNQKHAVVMIRDTLMGALRLSFFVGLGLSCILLTTSRRMLVPLIGNDSIDLELMDAAWRYIMIRSLGMPAAAMIGTSQAACLGLKDNQTPFKIIQSAAGLNLFLDVLLVGQKRFPWIGGTAGAAWATIFSQYFAVGLFLRNFTSTCKVKEEERTDKKEPSKTKGLLLANDGKCHTPAPWEKKASVWTLPGKQTLEHFAPFVVPVATTQVGRCSTYIAMGHVVSSTMDQVSMAAQQIITSIFYALIPIGDSCSLTAQSFLPSILSHNNGNADTTTAVTVRKTVKNIYKVAVVMGICLSMIALSIPLACPLLTSDPSVISTVKSVVPVMLAVLTTHGIFCASEGILVGYRDLKFLGRVYSIFFAVIPMLMIRLKYAAAASIAGISSRSAGGGAICKAVQLSSVWDVFLGYQIVRIITFASRAFHLIQKTGKK